MAAEQQIEDKPKEFSLSKLELANLHGREALSRQYEYLIKVIGADMDQYVESIAKTRLSLPENTHVTYDLEKGVITIIPKTEEIAPIISNQAEETKNGKPTK